MAPNRASRRTPSPLIGITTYAEVADWADWPQPVVLSPANYVSCVVAAGGVPVLLPPWSADDSDAAETLERLDGVMLIGGDDVCGEFYGQPEDEGEHVSQRHRPERDAFEIAVARRAWESDLPMLAICRGIQVLNVALGGTLIADVFEAGYDQTHRIRRGVFTNHAVTLEPGSKIHEICGPAADVPSHHHQAIDRLADGLVVSGRSDDGVIEAVEAPERAFIVGVQWHPEEGTDMCLFRALIDQAAR
jgi:anthranilate synthase component 2/putative glutamine amidotransferase